ncbi:hypothetical protein AAWM_08762 [Aspergillus awamori]|uniref:Uncharacterized protein n=1 Tax=Aspergillus awamori TaxID=105351 RepID=A0A401L2Z6_ASPAW|nr:hypothetical protein AAWM_08762 [Aspergillus awamori]
MPVLYHPGTLRNNSEQTDSLDVGTETYFVSHLEPAISKLASIGVGTNTYSMADTESQTSSNNASDCTSVELPPRPHRSQRIDYHLLNGVSDDEGDTESLLPRNLDWIWHLAAQNQLAQETQLAS